MYEIVLDFIEDWLAQQDEKTIAMLYASLDVLEERGPSLGRPLADTIKGSRIKNPKELRPASPGRSELRILYAFDPRSRAILLLAGDKSKGSKKDKWSGWYKKAIPEAETRYKKYIECMESHGLEAEE